MPILSHNNLKKILVLIQLVLCVASLHGAEYSISDPENLISAELQAEITKNQELILEDQNTLVSYAFYSVVATKLGTRMEWESSLKDTTENTATSEKFHLLICVGVFSKQNTVDIFYKNQPTLEDIDDFSTCISSLQQNLGSEPSIEDLIEKSPSIITDSLSYLNARPKYEQREKDTAKATRTHQFMNYIFRLVKIALLVIVPIIAFLIFWYMFASIISRRAHHFPTSLYKTTKKRLGAPHAATSISQFSK